MAKKKKGRPNKVVVKTSKAHRRGAHWVNGYWMRRTKKSFRNETYRRNKRRTPSELKKKGTRKEERKKKRMEQVKNQTKSRSGKQEVKKTVQTTFGKPRGPSKLDKKQVS